MNSSDVNLIKSLLAYTIYSFYIKKCKLVVGAEQCFLTSVAIEDSKYGYSVKKSLPFIAYLSIAKIYFHIQAGDVRVFHVTSPALDNLIE